MGGGDPARPAHSEPARARPLQRRRNLAWVAGDAETALHPSCTCRMGVDETSDIDPETMVVHGVDRLCVVDASAMRYVTNGNIFAPVMMLAEKAADLILGNSPLPPIDAEFYRHAYDGQVTSPVSCQDKQG